MKYVDCVIGNSSSGIIEAPSFNVFTINIGTRQDGRPRAESIMDISMDEVQISKMLEAVKESKDSGKSLDVVNPYGNGGAVDKMVDILASIDFNDF